MLNVQAYMQSIRAVGTLARISALALGCLIFLMLVAGVGAMSAPDERPNGNMQPLLVKSLGQTSAISPTEMIRKMLDQVNRDRLVTDLRRLSGEEPICTNTGCYTAANRQTGSVGLQWAMDYFYQELTRMGYSTEFRYWSREGWNDRNLIARKVGTVAPNEDVYFIAHADGVQSNGKERFPAADDNASGAVDLLEVARVLHTYSFSRTVVLLFSTGEEHGALGVKSYLDQLSSEELGRIQYAVDVDMVSYDANHDRVMEFWHGGHLPSLGLTQMMSDTVRAYQLDLVPHIREGCG